MHQTDKRIYELINEKIYHNTEFKWNKKLKIQKKIRKNVVSRKFGTTSVDREEPK